MNRNRRRYILCSLATGFIIVTLWSLFGFWGRWVCFSTLVELTPRGRTVARISPSDLLPREIEFDPNVVVHSQVAMLLGEPYPYISGLGMVDDVDSHIRRMEGSDILLWQRQVDGMWMYVDRGRGWIVYSDVERESETAPAKRIWLYAGPKGVAESPSGAIGRFSEPVVGRIPGGWVVFDSKLQRFFRVSFYPNEVVQGPEMGLKSPYEPIQIGLIAKHAENLLLPVEPPMYEVDVNEAKDWSRDLRRRHDGKDIIPFTPVATGPWMEGRTPVLDTTGRLSLLDLNTLELIGAAGSLPGVPERCMRSRVRSKPDALSAYSIVPVRTPDTTPPHDWKYVGCAVGALNHDGSALALAVYDERGGQSARVESSLVLPADVPGGPLVSTIRFGLENLHPPALALLSHVVAPYCPAGSGYRSIFLQPDSLVAKQGRNTNRVFVLRLLEAVAAIGPGILLAGILSTLVARRARAMGLSRDACFAWRVATLVFGVPAYLTYRLTEPRIRLVTCHNCGKLRRPDLDRCHHCQSLWEVPELTAPGWRVLDGAQETPIDSSPGSEAIPPEPAGR